MSDIEIVRLKGKRRPREPRLDANGRATARERYDRAYDRNRLRVLHEEHVCHICGRPVDKTLSGRDPLGPSIDHLIPVAAGGTHDRANLRLAHQRCNNQRQTDGLVTRPARARPAARLHPGLISAAVRIVVITGKLGAGKTTLRHQLAQRLNWQSLSIDDERAAGGNWGTVIHKVTMLTAPALVECVALIRPMKDALGQHNTSLLHVTCDEAERQRRLTERNTAFGDREYHDRWPSIRDVDTTHRLTDAQLAELAAWCRQGWGMDPALR